MSVTSLNRMAKSLLEGHFPSVLVEGEISNLAIPASGHWYLTLKDRSAQIRCAMFKGRNSRVRFKPSNGMQITVKGRLSIYEGRGDYQLIVDAIEEAGDGALRKAFEQLKSQLFEMGLFDQQHKQALAKHYAHIGVVSSATGAAFQDILSVLSRRFPGTRVTLFPTSVQGANANREICKAIESANTHSESLGVQVLIVGRGGGSLEDLQAFNEEQVAHAIFASKLPIISAVGHEIDFSIADLVADLRAPTPSAAAELLSMDQQVYRQGLAKIEQQLMSQLSQLVHRRREKLQGIVHRLKHPGRRLQEHAQTLDGLESRLHRTLTQQLNTANMRLQQYHRALASHSPIKQLQKLQLQCQQLRDRLSRAMQSIYKARVAQLSQLSRSLNTVSPLATLARGYSITYDQDNRLIQTSDDVAIGSTITSTLSKGRIVSTVKAIERDDSAVKS